MILVARASKSGGIVRPICFAVFKLNANSNFIGCSTGRSAGFAPLRILSTYVAARRQSWAPETRFAVSSLPAVLQWTKLTPKISSTTGSIFLFIKLIRSLLRQKRLGLSDLGPIGVAFCSDRHKLGEVGFGFLAIAGRLGGTRCSVEPPVAIWVLL